MGARNAGKLLATDKVDTFGHMSRLSLATLSIQKPTENDKWRPDTDSLVPSYMWEFPSRAIMELIDTRQDEGPGNGEGVVGGGPWSVELTRQPELAVLQSQWSGSTGT